MATKHSREHANPLKKKFVSPNANRKSPKFNISPKFRASLKEFHKTSQAGKKDASLKKKLYEWKKEKREKYHLGGNSSDPLNLNSLIDRDPVLSTPQASPLPTHGDSPIDVCLPPHEDDPLNLKCNPDDDLKDGVTPKKKKKKKHKNIHNDIENKVGKDHNQEVEKVEQPTKEKSLKKKKKHKKTKSNVYDRQESVSDSSVILEDDRLKKKVEEQADKVQSMSAEKSAAQDDSESEPPKKKRRKSSNASSEEKSLDKAIESSNEKVHEVVTKPSQQEPISTTSEQPDVNTTKPNNKKSSKVFIYGNYNRYYNYRNPHCAEDLRVKAFCREWFAGKDVLDIGCNVGDITMYIAKNFEPRVIIGNDIDNALIKVAKSKCQSSAQSFNYTASNFAKRKFPMSFSITNGPIAMPRLASKEENLKFPKNIIFKQENYVPPDDFCLANHKPMYDTILCLSVTKWVHLNWGDQGLKRMFKKIYNNLRPGGRLILEPQPFASYKKRRKLTDKIRANYASICFRPEQFIDYLLSEEVGFVAYEVVEEPQHGAPGFRRPIYLLTKPGNMPKS